MGDTGNTRGFKSGSSICVDKPPQLLGFNCTFDRTHAYAYTYAYAHTHVYTHTYVYTNANAYACTHAYAYAHTHAYAHTYAYTLLMPCRILRRTPHLLRAYAGTIHQSVNRQHNLLGMGLQR